MLAHDRSLMHERDGIWSHCNHPASFAANPAPRQVTLSQRLVKWRVLVAHQDVVCSPSNAARGPLDVDEVRPRWALVLPLLVQNCPSWRPGAMSTCTMLDPPF